MLLIVLFLTAASLMVSALRDYLLQHNLANFFRLFYLDEEASIPAWYQSSTLLLCALRIRYIAWVKDGQRQPYVTHWKVLSIIFAFLSLDELASLHEMAARSVRQWLGTGGFLHQGWVIPGLIFVALVTAAYTPFVFSHHGRTRWLLILSAVLYVGGAVGMEMVGGYCIDKNIPEVQTSTVTPAGPMTEPVDNRIKNIQSTTYVLLMTTEEFLEMMGVLVFMYTLLLPEMTAPPGSMSAPDGLA
jgi:hypothetical protein